MSDSVLSHLPWSQAGCGGLALVGERLRDVLQESESGRGFSNISEQGTQEDFPVKVFFLYLLILFLVSIVGLNLIFVL